MFIKNLAVLLAAVGMLASSAQAAPKYKITWLLGHANLDYFEEAAEAFKTAVEAGSRGDIQVTIKTATDRHKATVNGTAGPEIAAKVASGEAEMGHSFADVMGGLDGRMLAFQAPYLFRDYRHMEGVFEGTEGKAVLDGLREKGIVGLSFTYSGGASGVASVRKPLRKPEDLKDLKVGVYGDEASNAWVRSLGGTPVPIGHDFDREVVSMAQAGGLDAVVTTWRNFQKPELEKAFKYMNMMGSTYLVSVTYVNAKFFDSLPAEHRRLISEASAEAGRIERAKTIELNEAARQQLAGKGVEEVALSRKARKKFASAVQPAYVASLDALLGEGFAARMRKVGDGPAPVVPEGLARNWPVGP